MFKRLLAYRKHITAVSLRFYAFIGQKTGSNPLTDTGCSQGVGISVCTKILVYRIRKLVCSSMGVALFTFSIHVALPASFGQDSSTKESQLVYPNSSTQLNESEAQKGLYSDILTEGGSSVGMVVTILGYIIILGGMGVAAWYLFKRGVIRKPFSSSEGKLKVAESRMLGNRQYIMVVEYEDKKILLGVGPGKIDYLTSLDGYRDGFPKLDSQMEQRPVQEIA